MNYEKASSIVKKIHPHSFQRVLGHAQKITDQPILLRLDGGNDVIENVDVVLEHNAQYPEKSDVDFLIKWNPRKQNKDEWLAFAEEHGHWEAPRRERK